MTETKSVILSAVEAVEALREETGRPHLKIYRYGGDMTVAGASDGTLTRGLMPDEIAQIIGKHFGIFDVLTIFAIGNGTDGKFVLVADATEEKVNAVVDFIVNDGIRQTESGAWNVFYDEIEKALPFATEKWLREHHEAIKYALDGREETLSETWDATGADGKVVGFDCNFCGAFCPNWEKDGVFEAF